MEAPWTAATFWLFVSGMATAAATLLWLPGQIFALGCIAASGVTNVQARRKGESGGALRLLTGVQFALAAGAFGIALAVLLDGP